MARPRSRVQVRELGPRVLVGDGAFRRGAEEEGRAGDVCSAEGAGERLGGGEGEGIGEEGGKGWGGVGVYPFPCVVLCMVWF